ncbi:hypothetical protein [Flavobacterium sp.]|uniref:hypothetical protein n=1 Tax=Flavobacterium sp. TaxID=239 RepID=UPI0038FC8434
MKKFDNLTQTQFDLELLRLNQFIFRKKEEIKILSTERIKLFKAARSQNIDFKDKNYEFIY